MASFAEILTDYQAFPSQRQSLMLSTVNAEGTPDASYAPFVRDADGRFYIFVSGLSPHTANLLHTGKASILLMEDEAEAQQIFARRRLSYDCSAERIERDTPEWNAIADRFQARFGNLIDMFRQLNDFQIMQLSPYGGRFVVGFGAAYRVNPNDLSQLQPREMGKDS